MTKIKICIIACIIATLGIVAFITIYNRRTTKQEEITSGNELAVEDTTVSTPGKINDRGPVDIDGLKFDPYDLSAFVYTFGENELTEDSFQHVVNQCSSMMSFHIVFSLEELNKLYSELKSKLPEEYPNTLLFRANNDNIDINICEPGNSLNVLHTISLSTVKE